MKTSEKIPAARIVAKIIAVMVRVEVTASWMTCSRKAARSATSDRATRPISASTI